MPLVYDDRVDLQQRMPFVTRLLLRMFRNRLNRDVFTPLLSRFYERQVISSQQLHDLVHEFDPTQRGLMGRI